MDKNTLKSIEALVKSRFRDATILAVKFEEDEGAEGDRILSVTVIFESESGELDAQEAAGIVRHVRPKLREAGENAFPIFSFISKSDAELAGASA